MIRLQYLGWYMIPCSSETNDADGGYFIIDGIKYVQKQTVVRRRFREFVNLHIRLESNPELRHCVKGIYASSLEYLSTEIPWLFVTLIRSWVM